MNLTVSMMVNFLSFPPSSLLVISFFRFRFFHWHIKIIVVKLFESMCFVVKLHHILIWGWLKMSSEHPMDVYKTSTQWFEKRYIISTSAIIDHMDHNYCWIFKLRMDFCGKSIKWINNNRNLIESVFWALCLPPVHL